ncbi:MAG: helix-turn-helix domain-containing protein, partial [Oscillospiraceae bacterium]|nr:helix-turn-helix domain-containing protein [Oscillospiraceae bacterium]
MRCEFATNRQLSAAKRLKTKLSQEKLCAELQRRGCDIGRSTYEKYEAGELNIRASVIVELRRLYN